MKGNFVHLHLHTEYSLLDGACRIDRVLEYAKSLGQTAMAITDHGVMYGVIDFYKKAKAVGIKPIIGCEVYVAPRTMQDKVHRIDSSPFHLLLLCKDREGYQNLISLVSHGCIEGFYGKPRVDLDLLRKKSAGLIACSACISGQVPRLLIAGNYEGAKAAAAEYVSIFGKENFYIEVQYHGIDEQRQILPQLRRISNELGIGIVATNDCHYMTKEDHRMQHILTCIQTNTTVDNPSMEFSTEEFYVKSRAEMEAALPGFVDAIETTNEIADRCNLDFTFGELKLPYFVAPDGRENREYFRSGCYAGLHEKYGEHPDPAVVDRLEYELSVIERMGYVDYFLIVYDFIAYAKSHGIPVGPGRGSGAGSLAAYCIGITGIDPIRYQLIFERFLNPERVSMPDFDIDFCYVRRPEVIEYVVRRYGADHVAQIITFGTMAARAALRDCGRALGLPYQVVDQVAKLVPMELGITLEKALTHSRVFRERYDTDPVAHDLIEMAQKIEGMPRHASTHAAGVVISKEPVECYVPLQSGDGDTVITQFPMTTLEELGLLKMDFLGLRNLTVIDDAGKMIRTHTPDFRPDEIPLDDPAVFSMLSKGQTDGVFQFESGGMRQVLLQLRPERMEDLIAVLSLYRPGPMDSIPTYIRNRHNPSLVTYKHPLLSKILDVTYGCIVYQEQVMQICRELAGFSYGRADLVRRAMSKKKAKVMEEERSNFIHGMRRPDGTVECVGCIANGVPEPIANAIFDEMSSFASYAFNKSHAAAYAYVAYQTAYLKCHYPKEYMAALLTSILDSTDKVVGYIRECNRIGIAVLPPSVNESQAYFTATEAGIRFGLLAIKNLGRGIVAAIVEQRAEGQYQDFYRFCERLYSADLRRKALECLIQSGACDGFGLTRQTMLSGVDLVLSDVERNEKSNLTGQLNLFDHTDGAKTPHAMLPSLPEFDNIQLLKMERETIGLYLSAHPLDPYRELLASLPITPIGEILAAQEHPTPALCDEASVSVGAVVAAKRVITTKRGEAMAYLTLEDISGSIEAIVFAKTLAQTGNQTDPDQLLLVSGRLTFREEEAPKLRVESVTPLSKVGSAKQQATVQHRRAHPDAASREKKRSGLYLKVASPEDSHWKKCQKYLTIFEGETPVYVYFTEKKQLTLAPRSLWISLSEILVEALSAELGNENVAVVD